jgi:hypothetical protein
VKSPPELWAECSDAASLSRHLSGSFGEIRITALEPETRVAWEGEDVSGSVRLEPSGWGTKVILTARSRVGIGEEPPTQEPEPEPGPSPLPPAAEHHAAGARRGWFARLLDFMLVPAPLEPPAPSAPEPATEPLPVLAPIGPVSTVDPAFEHQPREEPDDDPAAQALREALDSLGQAHHRPFSRA